MEPASSATPVSTQRNSVEKGKDFYLLGSRLHWNEGGGQLALTNLLK
jgi:hypothetical protein